MWENGAGMVSVPRRHGWSSDWCCSAAGLELQQLQDSPEHSFSFEPQYSFSSYSLHFRMRKPRSWLVTQSVLESQRARVKILNPPCGCVTHRCCSTRGELPDGNWLWASHCPHTPSLRLLLHASCVLLHHFRLQPLCHSSNCQVPALSHNPYYMPYIIICLSCSRYSTEFNTQEDFCDLIYHMSISS